MFSKISEYAESGIRDAAILMQNDRRALGYTVAFVHGASHGLIISGVAIATVGGVMKLTGAEDNAGTDLMVYGGKVFAVGAGLALVNKGIRAKVMPQYAREAGEKRKPESELAKRFNALHSSDTVHVLPFQPKWENGTGYMNGLFTDPEVNALKDGRYASMDPHGRKILILKAGETLDVMYQRYSDNSEAYVLQDKRNAEPAHAEGANQRIEAILAS